MGRITNKVTSVNPKEGLFAIVEELCELVVVGAGTIRKKALDLSTAINTSEH